MDKKQVVIIGAGDHARGVMEIFRACNEVRDEYRVVGLLDDDPAKIGTTVNKIRVLGKTTWPGENRIDGLWFILAIANCRIKKKIIDRLRGVNPPFINAVHPSAIIAPSTALGRGVIIGAGTVIVGNSSIKSHVTVNLNATVGHDCLLEDYCTVAPGANITGSVKIGEGAEIGTNAAVVPGRTIGKWAKVGVGAVVLKDVGENTVVFGNPARVIG